MNNPANTRAPAIKDLFIFLVRTGYRYYEPSCRTWDTAFVMRNGESVLCILIRKNGVDFRLYDHYSDGISINDGGKISMIGGKLFRNHFNESPCLITLKVIEASNLFAEGIKSESINQEDGRSYLLNPNYQKIKKHSKQNFQDKWQRLVDKKHLKGITNYIVNDCSRYLGDGEWLD